MASSNIQPHTRSHSARLRLFLLPHPRRMRAPTPLMYLNPKPAKITLNKWLDRSWLEAPWRPQLLWSLRVLTGGAPDRPLSRALRTGGYCAALKAGWAWKSFNAEGALVAPAGASMSRELQRKRFTKIVECRWGGCGRPCAHTKQIPGQFPGHCPAKCCWLEISGLMGNRWHS